MTWINSVTGLTQELWTIQNALTSKQIITKGVKAPT